MASQNVTVTGQICDMPSGQNCRSVTLTLSELPYPQSSVIDPATIGQFWGIAFTSVCSLYLFSKGIGLLLNMVKRG